MTTFKVTRLAIAFAIALSGSLSQASFRDGYMSPQDLLHSLKIKFAGVTTATCGFITDNDRPTLGDLNPLTGEPLAEVPGTAFISYWDSCIEIYGLAIAAVGSQYGSGSPEYTEMMKKNEPLINDDLIPVIAGPLLAQIDASAKEKNLMRAPVFYNQTFLPTNPAVQKELIAAWVEWALGSDEEILAYGKMKSVDQYRADLLKHLVNLDGTGSGSSVSLGRAFTEAAKILFKRDEFLLYY